MSERTLQRRGGQHSAHAGRRFEEVVAALDPDGSMASVMFLWLLPIVALLLALLRS